MGFENCILMILGFYKPSFPTFFSGFEAKEKAEVIKRRHLSGHHGDDEGSSPDVSMTSSHAASPSPSRGERHHDTLLNVDTPLNKATRRSSIGLAESRAVTKVRSGKFQNFDIIWSCFSTRLDQNPGMENWKNVWSNAFCDMFSGQQASCLYL